MSAVHQMHLVKLYKRRSRSLYELRFTAGRFHHSLISRTGENTVRDRGGDYVLEGREKSGAMIGRGHEWVGIFLTHNYDYGVSFRTY